MNREARAGRPRKELAATSTALRTDIAALTARIAELSPKAVDDHDDAREARAEIKRINARRAELSLDLEVCEHAKASPEYRMASVGERLDDAFTRNRANYMHMLVVNLRHSYDRLGHRDGISHALGRRSTDPSEVRAFIEALPYAIAADITRETYTREDLAGAQRADALKRGDPNFDNSGKIEGLQFKLSVYERHTQQLLAETQLPPIPDALMTKET
jgi:hypothetical protein